MERKSYKLSFGTGCFMLMNTGDVAIKSKSISLLILILLNQ